jgi:hypothetical protein
VSAKRESRPAGLALRVVFIGAALVAAACAWFDPSFRDAEGALRGLVCLPLAVTVALVVLAFAVGTPLVESGFWLALAIVGQALALQTIDAGKFIHYQHYRPVETVAAAHGREVLAAVALHALVVAVGVVRHWPSIAAGLRQRRRWWQVALVAAVFCGSSATLSREVSVFVGELLFASAIELVNLVTIILVVLAIPSEGRRRLEERIERWLTRGEGVGFDRVALAGAVWVVAVSAALNYFAYERHPHVADEVVYLYHARYLADGRVSMPLPPVHDAFNVDLMMYDDDRWYCPVPLGWPALLALGVLAGAAWLVNPILGGASILLAARVLEELYDRRVARLGVLLLCTSPWFVFMNMSFMTHSSSFACALAALLGVSRARSGGSWTWALAGGGATGLVFLIRPLEGVILGAFLGAWALGLGARRLSFPTLISFGVGVVAVASIVFPYNRELTGDALGMPINAYIDKYYAPGTNALGFGPNRGLNWPIDPFPGYTPFEGVLNIALNVSTLNVELFGWAAGSLVFILALALRPRQLVRNDFVLAAFAALVVGFHFFYWFAGGPDFGPRYWYLCLLPCVALTARGALALESETSQPRAGSAVLALVLMCSVALVAFIPWRAVDKYYRYLHMRPDIRGLATANGFGPSLVLVRGRRHPDFASAAIFNPIDLSAHVPIYAWDDDPKSTAEVLEAYPDRMVWVVAGPSLTGRGFEVVAGPIPALELLGRLSESGVIGI